TACCNASGLIGRAFEEGACFDFTTKDAGAPPRGTARTRLQPVSLGLVSDPAPGGYGRSRDQDRTAGFGRPGPDDLPERHRRSWRKHFVPRHQSQQGKLCSGSEESRSPKEIATTDRARGCNGAKLSARCNRTPWLWLC